MDGLNVFEQCSLYALFYPPCRVGTESCSPVRIKVVNSLYQAEVAFFDEITETHSPVAELLGDIHYEPQIASDQVLACGRVVILDNAQAQFVFLLPGQQRRLVYLSEIFFNGGIENYG
jgi:hypothetical protein